MGSVAALRVRLRLGTRVWLRVRLRLGVRVRLGARRMVGVRGGWAARHRAGLVDEAPDELDAHHVVVDGLPDGDVVRLEPG